MIDVNGRKVHIMDTGVIRSHKYVCILRKLGHDYAGVIRNSRHTDFSAAASHRPRTDYKTRTQSI